MDGIIENLDVALPLIPLIVQELTGYLKGDLRGRRVAVIPYIISPLLMIVLWLEFGGSIWMYIFTGLVTAYTATKTYSNTKEYIKKRMQEDKNEEYDVLLEVPLSQ